MTEQAAIADNKRIDREANDFHRIDAIQELKEAIGHLEVNEFKLAEDATMDGIRHIQNMKQIAYTVFIIKHINDEYWCGGDEGWNKNINEARWWTDRSQAEIFNQRDLKDYASCVMEILSTNIKEI